MQLSQAIYSRVTDQLARQPFVERRAEPRSCVRGTARIVRGPAGDGRIPRPPRPVTVYVQDLSPGGAGLLSAAPVEAGEQFVLVMEKPGWDGAAAGDTVSLVCAAAYCRSLARDLYGIGVEFLRPGAEGDDASAPVRVSDFDALVQPQSDPQPYRSSDAPPST